MKCPVCGVANSVVIDSREALDGYSIRRRRKCVKGHRWTTYEIEVDNKICAAGRVTNTQRLGVLAGRRIVGGTYDEI